MSDTKVVVKKASWKVTGFLFEVTFPDGTKENFDMEQALNDHEDVKKFILNYGCKQLLSDSAAGEKGVTDKVAAMREKAQLLNAGELRAERKSKEPQAELTDEEIMQILKMPANIRAIVTAGMDKANKAKCLAWIEKAEKAVEAKGTVTRKASKASK